MKKLSNWVCALCAVFLLSLTFGTSTVYAYETDGNTEDELQEMVDLMRQMVQIEQNNQDVLNDINSSLKCNVDGEEYAIGDILVGLCNQIYEIDKRLIYINDNGEHSVADSLYNLAYTGEINRFTQEEVLTMPALLDGMRDNTSSVGNVIGYISRVFDDDTETFNVHEVGVIETDNTTVLNALDEYIYQIVISLFAVLIIESIILFYMFMHNMLKKRGE